MNDKELLQKIKENVSFWEYCATNTHYYELVLDDIEKIKWLIERVEQFEQAQAKAEYYEMKYENTGAIFNRRHMLDKIERYENAIKECIERMNEGGVGTRSFIYEKLKEVMGSTE